MELWNLLIDASDMDPKAMQKRLLRNMPRRITLQRGTLDHVKALKKIGIDEFEYETLGEDHVALRKIVEYTRTVRFVIPWTTKQKYDRAGKDIWRNLILSIDLCMERFIDSKLFVGFKYPMFEENKTEGKRAARFTKRHYLADLVVHVDHYKKNAPGKTADYLSEMINYSRELGMDIRIFIPDGLIEGKNSWSIMRAEKKIIMISGYPICKASKAFDYEQIAAILVRRHGDDILE